MRKLILPKHPHTGLKIFCKTCRVDNPNCKHYSNQVYRVRVHVPGTGNGVKTKFLTATEYDDAVLETIQFQKELSFNSYTIPKDISDVGTDLICTNSSISLQLLFPKEALSKEKMSRYRSTSMAKWRFSEQYWLPQNSNR